MNTFNQSNSGTVDTLTLNDGRKIEVSAVDGDTPYIVAGNNAFNSNLALQGAYDLTTAIAQQALQPLEFVEYALKRGWSKCEDDILRVLEVLLVESQNPQAKLRVLVEDKSLISTGTKWKAIKPNSCS